MSFVFGKARTRLIGDVKFKDPLSSNVEDIGRRGAFVGFGNTAPPTRADIFGLEQRGVKGTVAAGGSGNFCPSTGTGYVARTRSQTTPTRCRARTRICCCCSSRPRPPDRARTVRPRRYKSPQGP